jgi:hypothetical protein
MLLTAAFAFGGVVPDAAFLAHAGLPDDQVADTGESEDEPDRHRGLPARWTDAHPTRRRNVT